MKIQVIVGLILFQLFFNPCSEYQKLLNSDDTSEKYKQARITTIMENIGKQIVF